MYCVLNSFVSCGNDVTWPSGRLTNQSMAVLANVLMNSLHRTVSEPPTSIICVWKAIRWASGSSTPGKVTLGPTSVAGITASTIFGKNGVGNSLGGVPGSLSAPSRSVVWVFRSLHSSSFEWRSSCSWLATLPSQLGCVLGLLLTWPPLPEGVTSSP